MVHERPGHLMLTSALHDLADVGRLELQPLRSKLVSSDEEEDEQEAERSEGEAWTAAEPGSTADARGDEVSLMHSLLPFSLEAEALQRPACLHRCIAGFMMLEGVKRTACRSHR